MITFGGRPLNIYKANTYKKTTHETMYKGGEMEWRTDPSEDVKPATQEIADAVKPATQAISEIITPATQAIADTVKPATQVIQSETFVKKASELSSDDVYDHYKKNKRALIETSWASMLFGSSVGYILFFIGGIIAFVFNIVILLVIISICIVLYSTIQRSLDASHFVLGGVGKTMQQAVDSAVIPGFKIGPIKIPKLKLLEFLQKPTNDVKKAESKIPKKAYEVIIAMIKSFFENLMK